MAIRQIRKRDGSIVKFDRSKIARAISKAVVAVGGSDLELPAKLADTVTKELESRFHRNSIPAVEEIQDMVEKVLIKEGHDKTAKAYILYRQDRSELRDTKKAIFGFIDDSKLSVNGAWLAKERYLLREKGKVAESPLQMFRRVAKHVSYVERQYRKQDPKRLEQEFYSLMSSLAFLPAGRTLANAGTRLNQLANAFVIPIYDSLEDIYQAMREQATVHKAGGGTGFDFSHLRPKGDTAQTSGGVAAGPVSFLKLFDEASGRIRIGNRRASNMGVLRVDHPDIQDFITMKAKGKLPNFNISVAVTDEFMRALSAGKDYDLMHPRTGKALRKMSARQVFDLLVTTAWQCGDPGILFIDRINRLNPTSHVGKIEATSACAETPLHPYEASNLGSLNLDRFVKDGRVDWTGLKSAARLAVRFLDNVLDACKYPLRESDRTTKQMRRIGLGVMGLADMLYQLGIAYDSEEAIRLGRKLMKTIAAAAEESSTQLAKERGDFPLYRGSVYDKKVKRRNAALTAIAPTGSISMLAECSSGIEPNYAICYVKRVLEGKEFLYVNKHFEKIAREKGFYSVSLMRKIAQQGTLNGIDEVPEDVKRLFVVAHDVSPVWHVTMQAAFQKSVESAVSKTVNFPSTATIRDVEKVYLLAYKEGCKGITIYRDSSLDNQVMDVIRQ